MSLIGYNRDTLIGDSVGEVTSYGLSAKMSMKKVHICPGRHLAFAYTGDKILSRHIPLLLTGFLQAINKSFTGEHRNPPILSANIAALIGDRQFIIMTHDRTFSVTDSMPGKPFFEHDADELISYGLASSAFRVAIAHGLDTSKAALETCTYLYGCSISEVGLNIVTRDYLVPINSESPVAGETEASIKDQSKTKRKPKKPVQIKDLPIRQKRIA